MANSNQEIESKFYVRDLGAIQARLDALGANCIVPRGFEYNLRFDDAQNSLQRQQKALRLRKSDDIRMTFKGPGERIDGAISRAEFELIVNDFDTAQKILEALGYHVSVVYEKYRVMYMFEDSLVTLDELPYGHFVEVEGPSTEQIRAIAVKLGLKPEAAIPASYIGLFLQLKSNLNLPARNLTFWEFQNILLTSADLGVEVADE